MLACAGPASPGPSPGGGSNADLPATEPPPVQPGIPALPGEYDLAADVLHYDVEILFRGPAIVARARIDVAVNGAQELPLDFTGLAVEQASVDDREVTFDYEDGKLTIPLNPASDTAIVDIRYRGVPDDGLIIRTNTRGRPSAFVDNWPNRTRFWMPSVDHPSDKATASFTVHAPEEWEVVANGRMVGEPQPTSDDVPGGGQGLRTWRWETRVLQPSYTLVIGGTDFHIESIGRAACGAAPASPDPDGCVEVDFWVYEEDVPFARRVFGRAAEMVDYYTDRFGPYPFEKLAHVQSATRFGGMENSSAIFYSEEAITTGGLSEGTVSHEVAHQWFGDSATQSDWDHLWLSEGFATYFGNQFFEDADGVDSFRARMEEDRLSYLASDAVHEAVVPRNRPDNLFDLLNANSYQKGGWVLHMLRGVVGDDRFFEGIRAYYEAHALGNALTPDFQRVMEDVHGESLDWFFQQWVYSPGYPVLDTDWTWDEDGSAVALTVRQTQPAAWPTYRIPLTVRMEGTDGEAQVPLVVVGREYSTTIPSSSRPDRVELDPEGWVLKGPPAR